MDLKDRVRDLLAANDREGLLTLLKKDRKVVPALNRLLFDQEEIIAWRAVEALGWVARADQWLLEKIIGRLIYTLNEDSGSVGWMAPQALAEICVQAPDLVEDFFPQVINSMKMPVFRPGVVWAIGRVARDLPHLVAETGPALMECLSDPNPQVRGLAGRALGRLGRAPSLVELERLTQDQARLIVFEEGRLEEKTVAELAREALAALRTGHG
ncbi:MAG: DVU0298 family protein [Thermodesulfobacteriota bacterium]